MLIGHSLSDATGRILAVDHNICELLHRDEAELRGMLYADITHPDDLSWNVALIDGLAAEHKPITIRKRYLRPSAGVVWSDVHVSRLSSGPERGRLMGTIHRVETHSLRSSPEKLWRAACRVDANLQRRRVLLGEDLFTDHAWMILVSLYRTEAEGKCIDLPTLVERVPLRSSNLQRWLKVLAERGFVDQFDNQVCVAQLTAIGVDHVEQLLEETTGV